MGLSRFYLTLISEVEKISRKCRKSGKMGTAKKKFDEVKKNIAGQVLKHNSKLRRALPDQQIN